MVCQPSECTNVLSSGNDSFDIETAIDGLLADPERDSLELPLSLSKEQRKHAKKTIEHRQDVKCESFGLGADRRMYVFKVGESKPQKVASASECSPSSVSVKNTFIDDWIPADAVPADQRIVQSMPHNMFGKLLSAEQSGSATATVQESSDSQAASTVNEEAVSSSSCMRGEPVIEEYSYALGAEVVIDGLVKAPVFNGAIGTVQSWDAETMRYNVLLAFETASGQRWAKVKGENLRLASPEPPMSDADAMFRHG